MTDDKKTLKFQMMMSPQEAEQLDDWMFKNRLRSRAEAIRRLCQIGLKLEHHQGELNAASQAFQDLLPQVGRAAGLVDSAQVQKSASPEDLAEVSRAIHALLLESWRLFALVDEIGAASEVWRKTEGTDIEAMAAEVARIGDMLRGGSGAKD